MEHLVKINIIKKYMFDILKERFSRNEDIIERVSSALITEKDLQAFGKMIVDVYEEAYFKSLDDQKDMLKKSGIKVNIVPSSPTPTKEFKPIFKS